MARTLIERSKAWQEGTLDELLELGSDITLALKNIEDGGDEEGVRQASEELLTRERPPTFFRAQSLDYMAATEEEGANKAVRERLEDAKYWMTDLKYSIRDTVGTDPRVEELDRTIDSKTRSAERE